MSITYFGISPVICFAVLFALTFAQGTVSEVWNIVTRLNIIGRIGRRFVWIIMSRAPSKRVTLTQVNPITVTRARADLPNWRVHRDHSWLERIHLCGSPTMPIPRTGSCSLTENSKRGYVFFAQIHKSFYRFFLVANPKFTKSFGTDRERGDWLLEVQWFQWIYQGKTKHRWWCEYGKWTICNQDGPTAWVDRTKAGQA